MIYLLKHITWFFCLSALSVCSGLHAQSSSILSLEDCLNLAFDQNSSFTSIKNFDKIREQNRKILETGLVPEISVSSGVNQFVQNSTVVYADNILPTSQIRGARTYGSFANINTDFNLMDFGQTILALKAQKYADQASSWENVKKENTIIILICNNYFDCVISQELSSAANDKVKNSELILKISKLKLELGEVDSLEFYQALINYEQDKNRSLKIDLLYQENLYDLKLLLGIENSEHFNLDTINLLKN